MHEVARAVKLNYDIHGNTIPHLHLHLFPRHAGDPFENQPINPRVVEPVYGPGESTDFAGKAAIGNHEHAAMSSFNPSRSCEMVVQILRTRLHRDEPLRRSIASSQCLHNLLWSGCVLVTKRPIARWEGQDVGRPHNVTVVFNSIR